MQRRHGHGLYVVRYDPVYVDYGSIYPSRYVRERHSTTTGLVSGFGSAGDLGSAGALAKRSSLGFSVLGAVKRPYRTGLIDGLIN